VKDMDIPIEVVSGIAFLAILAGIGFGVMLCKVAQWVAENS